jgi:hypothetical protein
MISKQASAYLLSASGEVEVFPAKDKDSQSRMHGRLCSMCPQHATVVVYTIS